MTAVVIPRPGDDQGGPCPWGAGRRVQSAHAEGEVGGRSREGVELWPAEEVQVERCHRSRKRSMNEAIIHDYSNEMLSRGLNRYLITRIIVSAMLFGAPHTVGLSRNIFASFLSRGFLLLPWQSSLSGIPSPGFISVMTLHFLRGL